MRKTVVATVKSVSTFEEILTWRTLYELMARYQLLLEFRSQNCRKLATENTEGTEKDLIYIK